MSDYSSETFVKVFNDKSGDCVRVGPDADGLDLVEIRAIEGHMKPQDQPRVIMPVAQAVLVARAILKLYATDANGLAS